MRKIMKTIVAFFFAAFFASASFAQTQQNPPIPLNNSVFNWVKIDNATNSSFEALNWPVQDTIWATTGNQAVRSTDAGLTWEILSGSPGGRLCFATGTRGNCIGGNPSYLTLDGGQNWIPFSADSLTNVAYACRVGQTDTLIAGDTRSPYIFRSTNGGKKWSSFTWQKINYPIVGMSTITFAPDNKTGYIFGDMIPGVPNFDSIAALCIKTTDAGNTWKEIYTGIKSNIYSSFALSPSIVLVGGDQGDIYRTEDGGNTWKRIQTNTTQNFRIESIDFAGAIGLFVGAQGSGAIILQSNDSGRTWINVPNDFKSLYSIKFSPFQEIPIAVATGSSGIIVRTNGFSSVHQNLSFPLEVQVVPEPFTTKTILSYSIPKAASVDVKLYDILGKEVYHISSDGIQNAGAHSIEISGEHLPGGVYYFILTAGSFNGMGKVTKIVP